MEYLQQIITGCVANNRLSQEKLYREFYPALFLLCKRFFSDDRDALEALNDGMLKVYKNMETYKQEKGAFFNWVYTVVRNTALDKLRLIKQKDVQELNENNELIFSEDLLSSLHWKDIYTLLDVLAPATRVVCSLFYLEGYSINDICEAMQISSGTVKWHLSETRKKLKPVFKKHYL